jgi:2-polyprenyl-6-methoxyphenol hydroxylase-like FAD-dependent oxidoreductase
VRTIIVGAGPTGLYMGIALSRRGCDVVVVDRDPGPTQDGTWRRKGVMQFDQAHTMRRQIIDVLREGMPDVLDDLIGAGATIAMTAGNQPAALLCRRMLFDRVLRSAAEAQGISVVTAHVDGVLHERGRAVGIKVDGRSQPAELVIDAAGRASRFTGAARRPSEGADCGATYVSRQYQLRPDATRGPVNSPIGLALSMSGYAVIAFLHDNRAFSITFIHTGTDRRLRALRHNSVFEAAVRAVPSLSEWTEPTQSTPITAVLPGGRLYNTYRGQLDDAQRPLMPGMISVGDAVCTTTPLAGRGVSLALLQARELVRILDQQADIASATIEFDKWCTDNIRPWFDDHRYTDADRVRRWSGGDVDLSRRLPSDLIVAAGDADPSLREIVGPYTTMDALPASLAPAESRAREIYATGWRPAVPDGPTLAELSEMVSRTPEAA